ncbi:hypothetical protein DRE_05382 [Drechslerella stenobrocha 248]|uniref:Rhodopsin domain-containing protein n=1 Tax=Drechslerella stenobrocha 248 TaxID=1043628 RepID=W7HQU5_9PEZI|nr:hypothetical protein DRE_05382 [Drechslerella stenobrocha 248]
MKFVSPPNPQTEADRDYLRTLFPLFRNFPDNFEFPLAVDPNYQVPVNTLYCFVTGIIVCSITTMIVLLRFWVRSRTKGYFGMDDWVMVPTFFCYTAFNIVNIYAVFGTGLGYHLYDNSKKDIDRYLVVQYLHVIFSFSALHLCRISIQHLLLRLTPQSSVVQLWYLRILIAISYVFWLAAIFTQIFECGLPVTGAFDLKTNIDGTCISLLSTLNYGIFMSGHIILDALTIFPPLFVLIRLPMATAKKFNLSFLLTLGCLTMIFSGLKPFVWYKIMVGSFDITWHATAVAFWGILESSLALIIACLPALNRGIVRITKIDRLFNSNSSGSGMLSIKFRFKDNIYKGHNSFVRYTADATVHDTTQSYVELGSLGEAGPDEQLRGQSPKSGERHCSRAENESPHQITVERTFQLTEERASVLEQEIRASEEDSPIIRVSSGVSQPPKAKVLSRN